MIGPQPEYSPYGCQVPSVTFDTVSCEENYYRQGAYVIVLVAFTICLIYSNFMNRRLVLENARLRAMRINPLIERTQLLRNQLSEIISSCPSYEAALRIPPAYEGPKVETTNEEEPELEETMVEIDTTVQIRGLHV